MESIWSKTCRIPQRESLQQDIRTEVAVIGAGMAGILTAYLLQEAGKQVVLLEAERIAGGQTRNTTAKITSQHGKCYRKMIDRLGEEKARQYAAANQSAVEAYRKIIEEEQISCDFEDVSAFIYSDDRKEMEEEAEAARLLDLPAVFTDHVQLPVKYAGAVQFSHQAQFHPLKFIKALAEKLTIYEQSQVLDVEEHLLRTACGSVTAEQIVFACHYPFPILPGAYFARMHQERAYFLALKGARPVKGPCIGVGKDTWSFRNYENLVFLGGESHRTGENSEGGRYDALRRLAKELYPDSEEVACWSAQDCMTADEIPYIGKYAPGRDSWFVATGFRKWGMSTSMAAARILRDLICGRQNACAEVFDPVRFSPEGAMEMLGEGGQAVKGLVRRIFQIPDETAKEIPAGHGAIVTLDGEKAGVYKHENGELSVVDIRCPHMGCQLEWNPDEKSWDCPCHGSRFDYKGNLISNPAQEGLKDA